MNTNLEQIAIDAAKELALPILDANRRSGLPQATPADINEFIKFIAESILPALQQVQQAGEAEIAEAKKQVRELKGMVAEMQEHIDRLSTEADKHGTYETKLCRVCETPLKDPAPGVETCGRCLTQ